MHDREHGCAVAEDCVDGKAAEWKTCDGVLNYEVVICRHIVKPLLIEALPGPAFEIGSAQRLNAKFPIFSTEV